MKAVNVLSRNIFIFLLSFQLALPQLAFAQTKESTGVSANAESPLFSQRIQEFINKLSNSTYALQVTDEEMRKAIEMAGMEGLVRQTGVRAAIVRGEEFMNAEHEIIYKEMEHAIQIEAEEIAQDLYQSASTEELNLKFLVLAHHYLYNPASRGAIREIAQGFDSMIGESYFRELEKKKEPSDQYLKGTLWTGLLLGLLSLRRPTQGTKTYLTLSQEKSFEFMRRLSTRMRPSAAKPVAKPAVQAVTNDIVLNNSKASVIESLRKMGAYVPRERHDQLTQVGQKLPFYSPQMIKYQSKNFVAGLSRYFTRDYILNWMRAKSASDNFKNFLFLTGATTVGGMAYAGIRSTQYAFQTMDLGDQYLDLRQVIDRDYTELSTLMLQCQMKALKEEVSLVPSSEEVWSEERLQFLRSWLADYELLRRFSLDAGVTQKRLTSMPVKYYASRGAYIAQINYLEHKVEEVIPCVAPENTSANANGRVEISLEEALLDLTHLIQ